MPWNGSGRFSRTNGVGSGPTTWGQAEQADRDIRSDDHDTHDQDLADGLELAILRDGQNSPTQDLPMNSKKHTGVANATADNQYAGWGQAKSYTDTRTGARVSNTEKTAGTVTSVRRFSPGDVGDMIDRHARLDTLTEQASIAWDVQASPVADVTLGGNRTLANPTNAKAGGIYVIEVKQDASGGRTLQFGNDYAFGEEGTPTLSTGGGKSDVMSFLYSGSKMKMIGFLKGF